MNTEWTMPADIEPEEPLAPPAPEELLANLKALIQSEAQRTETPFLSEFLTACQAFLRDKPAIPESYQARFARHGGVFDYYQIALPEDRVDPYLDEHENLEKFKQEHAGENFDALLHYLMTRNRFLFDNGHVQPMHCPKPALMLETPMGDDSDDADAVDWDCCAVFFADGSYACYNLDGNREEELGQDATEILSEHADVLSRLALTLPLEGEDWGELYRPEA